MFAHQGIWLPDGEKHFPEWMTKNGEIVDGRGTYQIRKLRAALAHCKQLQVAVDVGAHVGLWSMHLAKRFQQVHAFEPIALFRDCWTRNLEGIGNALVYPVALGSVKGKVRMAYDPADSGGTHVDLIKPETGGIDILPLDEFDLGPVDFIKIDCEGYEHHVIEGARETIEKYRPAIIVEQKPHKLGPNFGIKGTPAVDLLKAMGYVVRQELSGDYILTA
jgi:FkbM family methyltransferase